MADLVTPFYLKGWTPRFDNDGNLSCWVKDGEETFRPSAHWDVETKSWRCFIKGTVKCYSLNLRELVEVLEIFEKGKGKVEEKKKGVNGG